MWARRGMVYLVVVGSVACGEAARGTPTRAPASGAPAASATTSDPRGLRVLADRPARHGDRGLIATSRSELEQVWSAVGLDGTPPVVDFATHVVLGTNFEGGCEGEIVAAHVDRDGVLSFEQKPPANWCDLVAYRIAEVVAVPRAIVGERFVWLTNPKEAYQFRIGPAPEMAVAANAPASAERASIASWLGVVELPPAGQLALRALDDGREVWVVHRESGDISIVLADRATQREGVRSPVRWNERTGRFDDEHYDSHGRSVAGRPSLESLTFKRLTESRVAVGSPAPLGDGPIEARNDAPVLAGPARPYQAVSPTGFDAIADGELGRVTLDLVYGASGQPRLCEVPDDRRSWTGCPENAPTLAGASAEARAYLVTISGPLVVRRRGSHVDFVIDEGHGQAFWLH